MPASDRTSRRRGSEPPIEAALPYEHGCCSKDDGGQTNHNDEDAIR